MLNRSSKTVYHPFILVAFYLNILPDDLIGRIPRSTIYDWKHKTVTELMGYDWYCQQQQYFTTLQAIAANKRLMRWNRALLRVIALSRFVKKYAGQMESRLFHSAEIVVHTIQKIQVELGLTFTLKALSFSHRQYWKLRQKTRCAASVLNRCLIKHPVQLAKQEVKVIKDYCTDSRLLYWPLSSIYHRLIRETAFRFQLSTFYKYVRLLGLKRTLPPHRRKNHAVGIRSQQPLELLHADVTVFKPLDQIKTYIYLIQDNFSRMILGWRLSTVCNSQVMKELLQHVHAEHLHTSGISACCLMTDDGSENLGVARAFMNTAQQPTIQHIIAQRDISFSNSMIEALHKNLKYRFLYHKTIPDIESLQQHLVEAIEDYNHRPNAVLDGLTPLEVLAGKTTDKLLISTEMQAARIARVAVNQQQCCSYSF